ncbi:MAG: toxin-antitoxin system HicB family antitoxin [Caldilineaceae bacterium]|nr:toxin-antitoxin system HicB family antitoxin [Caldilineaceae bacterium]
MASNSGSGRNTFASTYGSKKYGGKFVVRIPPELHERLAIRALIEGDSLNNYCKQILEKAVA